jgi:hypothetical protein
MDGAWTGISFEEAFVYFSLAINEKVLNDSVGLVKGTRDENFPTLGIQPHQPHDKVPTAESLNG